MSYKISKKEYIKHLKSKLFGYWFFGLLFIVLAAMILGFLVAAIIVPSNFPILSYIFTVSTLENFTIMTLISLGVLCIIMGCLELKIYNKNINKLNKELKKVNRNE